MQGLAALDGRAAASIALKAAGYLAALLAIGGRIFAVLFPMAPEDVRSVARRVTLIACLCGILLLLARLGLRAGRIAGMGLPGIADPMMLGFVWNSPFGAVVIWREAGYAIVLAALALQARWLAVAGGVGVAVSFAQIGHVAGLEAPLLSVMLSLHVLIAGVWVAALLPLRRAADLAEGAAVLHRFGQVAVIGVSVLILAGMLLARSLVGSASELIGTAYGVLLLTKVASVAGLLAFAAHNKLRLVPALVAGKPEGRARLRRSIGREVAVVGAILLVTAAFTTVTTPPVNM